MSEKADRNIHKKVYNVMIVEDQVMPRQLFEVYVNSSDRYDLTFSIENAAMAEIYCMKYQIDLIIMDVITAMGESGLKAAEVIKKKFPHIKIIIVTSLPEFSFIERARRIGVESFWYKEVSREPIISLMDRTMAGESVYPDRTPEIQLGLARSSEFSARELEVLRELITGDPNAVIAEKLHMSVFTVRDHVKHMLDKTGFRSRTELAVKARESGLVVNEKE